MAVNGDGPKKSKALLILFQGFNTLDANGPLETFKKSGISKIFDVVIAAEDEITTSVEGLQVKRHVAIDGSIQLADFDLLIVPGGGADNIQEIADKHGPFVQLIEAFSKLQPSPEQYPRTILSICSGALFLGNLGIFNDLHCTTHYWYYKQLSAVNQKIAAKTGGRAGVVLPARYVDSGPSDKVRIISAGGISCGIDAALHVIRIRVSEKEALETAELLDYAWRTTDGVVFGETY